MAVDFVISIGAKIGEYLVAPIGRQIGYVLFYNRNVGDFKNQVKELENKRVEVQGRAAEAERNGDDILPGVKSWLETVEKIKQESSELDGEFQVTKRCFNVPYPSLQSRYQGSKKAKKTTALARELEQSGNFERVSLSTQPSATRFKSTEVAENFESRRRTFKEIKEAIEDAQISMIGIYGMPGVGKTVLVKEVGKQVKDGFQFEEVVMAVVSQPLNLERIQQQIAEMLGLKFERESELGRAERLNARLKQKKKVLVILDDIWEPVNLEAIGIPFGAEHEGCKIVLTSRREDVCKQMHTQKNIEVGGLLEQEAWNLFQKMAGDCVHAPQIKPLASKVVKRCSGVPLAIVTVARALEYKSLSFWKDAANRRLISKEVFSALQLSYDYLERKDAKLIFLLCCIYGEDHNIPIEDLWKYGFSLGLFQEVDTEEAARDRAFALAESLKYSCLLQEGSDGDCVKMHDVVRDFAISVASDYGFLVRSGPGFNNFPESIKFKRYTRISIISDAIHIFPDRLECPKLQFLYLECSHPSLKVPDNFFSGMKLLKVLVMSRMDFLSLPPSLVALGNLQTLCLDNCSLKDVSIIGTLKELKFLSFIGSELEELPKEIGELIHLKLLDLSRCEITQSFSHVILRLSQLEGLYMGRYSSDSWEVERGDKERRNVSLRDLKHMSRLTSIHISVPDDCLPDDGDSLDSLFNNLLRFQICIGTYFPAQDHFLYSRALTLENVRIPLKLLSIPLKTAEYLHLEAIRGLENILYDLDTEGVLNLKCLTVKKTRKVEYIFNAKASVSPATSSSLVELNLSGLPDLKAIYHGYLPSEFFVKLQELELSEQPALINIWKEPAAHACLRNLRVLIVEECNGLKNLFPHFTAEDLSELVKLRVNSCEIMEVIFQNQVEAAAATMNDIEFPHLQILELKSLPNLKKFYSKMKCSDADTKEPLFSKKVAFPTLEKLIISEVGDVEEIWHHQILDKSFFQLKILQVDFCHQLQNVVPFHMLTRLHNLEELSIEYCHSVKEVVELEGLVVDEGEVNGRLSQLKDLRLRYLPELKHIMWWDKYPHATLSFKNLGSIHIFKCNCLKSIFPPSIASSLVQLQRVEIDSCETVEAIISNEGGDKENCFEIVVFPRLHTLILKALPSLACFYQIPCPAKEANSLHDLRQPLPLFDEKVAFPVLEKLIITDFDNLKEIWHPQVAFKSFSQVKVLELKRCHKVLNVIPFYMLQRLQSLESLEELYVEDCDSVEKVVEHEGLAVVESVNGTLSQLRILKLRKLPKLKSVFPPFIACSLVQLQEVEISSCQMMETIIVKEKEQKGNCIEPIVFPELHTFKLENLRSLESFMGSPNKEGNLDHDLIQPLFDKKVAFPVLEKLIITDVNNLKEIWHPQVAFKSFSQVKVLELKSCYNVLNAIPFYMLGRLQSLEELYVENCYFVEKVVEHEGLAVVESVNGTLPQLRILKLRELPLKSVFPPSIACSLVQLQEVEISSCHQMETIIVKEKEQKGNCTETIVFPELHTFKLVDLPSLESFMGSPNKEGNLDHNLIQPLFDKKVIFPVLKKLVIHGVHNLKEMWHPQIPANSFSQLKVLDVQRCHQMLNVVPFHVLRMAQSLEEIRVQDCDSMEEIVVEPEGLVAAEPHVNGILFTQLRKLSLCKLPKLKHIMYWDQYPQGTLVFKSLYSVIISWCNSLKSLFPPSIANSLVQLEELYIDSCDLLETIIAKEREGEENFSGIIMFPQLQKLTLYELPNIMSFHTELNWSSLLNLQIGRCPAMKTFISSIPCSQKLKKGVDELQEAPEKGNLCSSQRPFFDNKVALTSLTYLGIGGMDNMQQIFDNQHPDEFLSQLRELCVVNCDKVLRVVPSYLLPGLRNLRRLEISECKSVEEILEGGVGEKQVTAISFTKLEELELNDLPNLRIFCSGNYTLNCLFLNSVQVEKCPRMETFSSGLIIAPELERVKVEYLGYWRDDKYMWEGDLNTTIKRIFHGKNMPGIGSVSDESSHKLDSEQGNDANGDELAIQGRISGEKKDAEESETVSHLYRRESTSITVSATKGNIVTNIDQEHDMLAIGDFSGSEPPRKLASKEEVISNKGKGKAVAVVEGIDERLPSSSRTPISSHQPCSISGVSIMEDTRTLLDARVFPEDIASGAIDRQSVRQNMDKNMPSLGSVSDDSSHKLHIDMGQNVPGVGDANGDELAIQGRISSEKKNAEESETASHLYSRESTSITVSSTKENIVTNIDQEHDMLAIGDFSGSEPPRKLASKEEVISNEGKGKAVAVVEGIDDRLPSSSRTPGKGKAVAVVEGIDERLPSSSRAPVSSHQPCSISGVSIMEDTRTLLDAGVFPEDIASGALDRQNVRRNMDKLRPDQMVISRDEFESLLQRDRDWLRWRVETLEDLLVSGYRGSRPPGLSTTLDVGWAAWSFLLVFSLLFFLLFSFWLFVL